MIPFTHKKLWVLQEEGSDVGAVSIPHNPALRNNFRQMEPALSMLGCQERAVWKLHLSTFLFVRRQLIGEAALGEEGDEQCEG